MSKLSSDLQTARVGTETCRFDYNTQVTCFQSNSSHLQSALDAKTREVVDANQSISKLKSDLQTARVGTETRRLDYDTQVTCFQSNSSNLQSALDAKTREVVDANQSISKLTSDLQATRVGTEIHRLDYST